MSKVRDIILDVVGVDIDSLSEDTVINTISEWDSFNNLMLVSRFQEELGVEFTALDIENIHTIKDLLSFLK